MKLLIPLAVLLFSFSSIGSRLIQIIYPGKRTVLRLFQFLLCMVGSAAFLIKGGIPSALRSDTVLFGVLFGVFFACATLFGSYGTEFGPMSLTSVITNLSFLIPTVYACIADSIPMKWNLLVGFSLIVILFCVIAIPPKGAKQNRILPIWFPIVLFAFVSNGITAVIQKYYGAQHPEESLTTIMCIAYFTSALIFVGCFTFLALRKPDAVPQRTECVNALWLSVLAGAGSFGGNYLLGILCNTVAGSILYPCLNGGLCILCSIISFVFFKEKIYLSKVLAMIIGVVAIVILNI